MTRFFAASASAWNTGGARELSEESKLGGSLTLCAFRLREPHRVLETSDTPCHASGGRHGRSIVRLPRSAPTCVGIASKPLRQKPFCQLSG